MKYGILGGSFDPPHLGHAHVAHLALDRLGLDEVIWIPANKNPNKTRKVSSPGHRLAMCKLAIEGEDKMAVSDIELTRGGKSFLVDTLEELTFLRPGDYWFVLGADALASFNEWKDPERIVRLCRLAVLARHGSDLTTVLSRLDPGVRRAIDVIEAPMKSVSSSNIRDCIAKGEDYSHFVTPTVYGYIKEHGLYQD